MSFESEFLDLMPHTVQIAPWSGINKFNEATFGPDVSYRCRIVGKGLALRRENSEQMTPIFTIYLYDPNNTAISARDRITLPADSPIQGAAGDDEAVIFTVSRIPDEDGQHHVVLNCGWQYHRQGQS